MSPNSVNINHLRVATPCPVSWEQMAGNNRVRFCDHCQLNVYNISELSRTEAESLIASNEGRLCARLYRRADGTILTKDCPVGLRALRLRVSKRATVVFAALASLAASAFGQQATLKDEKTSCPTQTRITRTNPTSENSGNCLSGNVAYPNGANVVGAIITITNEATKETKMTTSSASGKFEFVSLTPGRYELKIEGLGFESLQLANVTVEACALINVETVVQLEGQFNSGITSMDYPAVDTRRPGTTIISGDLIRRLPIQ